MTETSMDMDQKTQQFDEDVQKVLDLLQEKSYFKARDEILKHNEVDISEILEEVLEDLAWKDDHIFRMRLKDCVGRGVLISAVRRPGGDRTGHNRPGDILYHRRAGL